MATHEPLPDAQAESDDQPPANQNAEVARLFAEIGDILELKGEQPFRYNAYRTAARSVGGARERLDVLFQAGRLRELHGVGAALEAKIVEYLTTGRMEFYERTRREFPSALASLLQVPGLGPTRARALYQELGVSTVGELEEAARSGRIKDVPGFGDRFAETVLESLEKVKQRSARGLLSDGWLAAEEVKSALGRDQLQLSPGADDSERIVVVGSVRRMSDTIGGVDLMTMDDHPERLLGGLVSMPNVMNIEQRTGEQATVLVYGGLHVRMTCVQPASWGSALIWHTGSRAHVARLEALAAERGWTFSAHGLEDGRGKRIAGEREAGVYEALGLPWIPPELREDQGEIEAAQAGQLPRLVALDDIKGDLHCHTSWTDGTQTLEEMAKAAKARGYEYMALTDHSQNLTVARGLTPDRLREQRALVNRVNHKLAPFVVLHGTEMDILLDGALDFPDDVLRELDYVSASVHSGFRQSKPVMTARMQRAVSSPLVNTLNHPHGRKIGLRDGYAVDMEQVIAAAASAGCAIELNATPNRLDLNGAWARRAHAAGVRLTVSSDAHSVKQLDYMQFGVGSARRGWLEPEDVLNTRSLAELRQLLAARRG